jgi:homoserine O-succinyltransferase/O-acetyltransferase
MPVIINSEEIHPFLPTLGSPLAIERKRAERQDIRPMEFAIINLMADKIATERQLALWLGNTVLQVSLTFVATDSYVREIEAGRESKNTPTEHIRKFYSAFSDIRHKKFDGLIVSGTNALKPRVDDEVVWPEVAQILEWSTTNALSTLLLCWGAQAALKYFHNIDSCYHYDEDGVTKRKLFGLFNHRLLSDKTGVLFGFPDVFPTPVSRWTSPKREDIEKCKAIEILADSIESGPNMLAESAGYDGGKSLYPKRVYILNHPEYETETLGNEYRRDSATNPSYPKPLHYFPDNDPTQPALNLWRHTANIYSNWIKAVYEATPYNREDIPRAFG